MDADRLQTIIDWMHRSPLSELELADGDFRVRLVRNTAQNNVVTSTAPAAPTSRQVTAPSYGVIHLAGAPGAEPFVKPGSTVRKGQSLCVIEAMKVFTPIESEDDGQIAEILVADGAEVSAGQPLFRLG